MVPGVLNQYSVGLGDLWKNKFNNDSKLKFKKVYKIDQQDLNFTSGKTNYIILGSLMFNNPSKLNTEKAKVLEFYKANKNTSNDINIIYKGHPRESQSSLDQLKEILKQEDPTSVMWFHEINPRIPFEVFLISGDFDDNTTTKTNFRFYLDGSSTTSQVFYDYGGSQDQVVNYVFNNTSVYERAVYYYGLKTAVIDFSKKEIR